MPPYLTWYWLHYHPELFQREFTDGELVLIAVVSICVASIAILPAFIVNHYFKKF